MIDIAFCIFTLEVEAVAADPLEDTISEWGLVFRSIQDFVLRQWDISGVLKEGRRYENVKRKST